MVGRRLISLVSSTMSTSNIVPSMDNIVPSMDGAIPVIDGDVSIINGAVSAINRATISGWLKQLGLLLVTCWLGVIS